MNSIKNKKTGILLILFFGMIVSSAIADVGPNWIEQWGIRWTFDKNISLDGSANTYRYGQFVNGDYWIIGPITITSINPPSQTVNGQTVNGSMVNPIPYGTQNSNWSGLQGYHSEAPQYDATLNIARDLAVTHALTIPVSSSLISTISVSPITALIFHKYLAPYFKISASWGY